MVAGATVCCTGRSVGGNPATAGHTETIDEMDLFVVRTKLRQAELDPSAVREAAHLRAWLEQPSNQGYSPSR